MPDLERIEANWRLFRPDSLKGYVQSYLRDYGSDTYYQWSAVHTEGLSGDLCLKHRPVVERLRMSCFDNTP
jgi:hypothetical protein